MLLLRRLCDSLRLREAVSNGISLAEASLEAHCLRVFWYIEAIYAQIFRTVISKSVLVRKDIRRSRALELVSKALLLEGFA